MNCAAVERAKSLINAEGLHLVEHILLRPHCDEDCTCEFYKKQCDSNTHCHFTWEIPGVQDPCNQQQNICFVPGADPYSFIATIALPAWPARFRKKENRQLLEDILQREAPAHILLRILWLAPHDLCCFEGHFKKWNQWLAQKNICTDKNPTCDFLKFLFERNFECLTDCTDCPPCKKDVPPASPCFNQTDTTAKTTDPNLALNQINELFCWETIDCGKYTYVDCDEKLLQKKITPENREKIKKEEDVSVLIIEETPQPQKAKTAQPVEVYQGNEKATIAEQPVSISRFVNGRLSSYKHNIDKIVVDSAENETARKASNFLADQDPSTKKFEELIELVLINKTDKDKKIKCLSTKHKKELINNLTRHFFDKQVFAEKDMKRIIELKEFFGKLKTQKIDVQSIYKDWLPNLVKKYEPALDIEIIESLMM